MLLVQQSNLPVALQFSFLVSSHYTCTIHSRSLGLQIYRFLHSTDIDDFGT